MRTVSILFVFLSCAIAAETSQLTQKVIPVNPESDAQITRTDIKDVVVFSRALMAGEEGSPEARLYGFFPPTLKEELVRWEFEDTYPEALQIDIVKAVNRILRRGDLYDTNAWASADLPEELVNDYGEGYQALGAVDKTRVNRRLLTATFPELLKGAEKPSFPERPDRLHVFGDKFLSSGDLKEGIKLPTGAVWQPSLFAFGQMRTAVQSFDPGDGDSIEEIVARWDINFNLALTPTERILIGFRPLDEAPDFTGYDNVDEEFDVEFDPEPETLFLEGDFGEVLPGLDNADALGLDLGFAVGRQPHTLQRGFLIEDTIDSIGIVKNNIILPRTSNVRITGLFGWGEIDRNGGNQDSGANLLGVSTAIDFPKNTLEIDLVSVLSDTRDADLDGDPETAPSIEGGNSYHAGLGTTQRQGLYNTSFRVNASFADEEDSVSSSDGVLLFADISATPAHSHDLMYATAFFVIDDYSAAARRPTAQGPLGPAGILFAGTGLGRAGAALSSAASEVAGGSVGYQAFWNDNRTQLISELGGRVDTSGDDHSVGLGFRLQHAMGQHWIVRADAATAVLAEEDLRHLASLSLTFQY